MVGEDEEIGRNHNGNVVRLGEVLMAVVGTLVEGMMNVDNNVEDKIGVGEMSGGSGLRRDFVYECRLDEV